MTRARLVGALTSTLFLAPSCLALGGASDSPKGVKDGGSGTAGLIDGGFPRSDAHPDSPDTSAGGAAGASTGGTSSGGSSSGGTSSGGTSSGGAPSSTLYTYDVAAGAWTSIALSSAWSGTNAPPPTAIVAVTQLEHFDRLLVFSGDGTYYLRADGLWQPPVPTLQMFPALSGLTLGSVYHVSSPPGAALDEGLTFVANPVAVAYEYHSNDAIVFVTKVTMTEDPPPASPQVTGQVVFDFEMRDPSKYGTADYYHFYSYYTDGYLHQFDAAFGWKSWPVLQSAFWLGKTGSPDPTTLVAAWFDQKFNRAMFIGE